MSSTIGMRLSRAVPRHDERAVRGRGSATAKASLRPESSKNAPVPRSNPPPRRSGASTSSKNRMAVAKVLESSQPSVEGVLSLSDLPAEVEDTRVVMDTEDTVVIDRKLSQGRLFVGINKGSTSAAPGNGGLRVKAYPNPEAAKTECHNLAEAMSRKHRVYNTGFSGAKLVFDSDVPVADIDKQQLMQEVAGELGSLEGLVFTGCDMNVSMDDMEYLDELSPFVLAGLGSDVDTNIATARGALAAIVRTKEHLGLPGDFKVLVQGVGNVGSDLAKSLVDMGATVYTMDYFPERADIPGAKNVSGLSDEEWSSLDIDIFSPNAAAGVITRATAERFRCSAIVGAANVPFRDEAARRATAERGIVFVPEYITSAGAIIVDSLEWRHEGYADLRPNQVYQFVYDAVYAKVGEYAEKLDADGREKGNWAELTDQVSEGMSEGAAVVGTKMGAWAESTAETFDVVVIGAGMAGTAAAYQLSKVAPDMRGVVLEAGPEVAHKGGSSYGSSRMFRQMYSDPYFSQLQSDALALWKELEEESGETLLDVNGLLFYGSEDTGETVEGSIPGAKSVMTDRGIPHEYFSSDDALEDEYGMDAKEGYVGIMEAAAGSVNSSAACKAMMDVAQASGAWEVRCDAPVQDMWQEGATGLYHVTTSSGTTYVAKKVVVAAGAWTNDVLSHLGAELDLEVWGVHWGHYKLKEGAKAPQWFHFGKEEEELIYGFPDEDGVAKVGADFAPQRHRYPSMEKFDYEADAGVTKQIESLIGDQWGDVYETGSQVDMNVSPYTMTKDSMFVLDRVPGHPDVSVFSGGNGRAFKFAPILGRALADLVLDAEPTFDIKPMAMSRPELATATSEGGAEGGGAGDDAFGRAHVPFGDEGNAVYSNLTLGCFDVVQNSMDLVTDSVKGLGIIEDGDGGWVRLADFGSADGGPEMPMVHAVRDMLPAIVDLEACFEDQPNNDFKSLFYLALGMEALPVECPPIASRDGVFFSAVGRSFFDPCFPKESVDIATSFTAMHWLSRLPGSIPDGVHHTISSDADSADTFGAQADSDWRKILGHRARELKPGASMVIVVFGLDPSKGRHLGYSAVEGEARMYEELDSCWAELRDEGKISDAEYKEATFCNYYRTEAEMRAPLEDGSLPLRLDALEWRDVRCPFGRGEAAPAGLVGTVRTWSNSTFVTALDASRAEGERKELVDEMYGRYEARIAAEPARHHMDYWHAYIRFTKTA